MFLWKRAKNIIFLNNLLTKQILKKEQFNAQYCKLQMTRMTVLFTWCVCVSLSVIDENVSYYLFLNAETF